MDKPSHRSHPNIPTVKQLKELSAYRELYRKQQGKLPTGTYACNKIGIGYRTVRRHGPELFEKGDDPEFRW
jgi:hypothetical protein